MVGDRGRRPPGSTGGRRKNVDMADGTNEPKGSTPKSSAQDTPLRVEPPSRIGDALAYAEDGYFVVPFSLAPNGGPLVPLSAATRDVEQIRMWWERWPNAGVGCPHAQNNLLMIEVASQAARQFAKRFLPETDAQASGPEITRYYYRVDYSKGEIQSERWLDGEIRLYGSDSVHALPSYGNDQPERGES